MKVLKYLINWKYRYFLKKSKGVKKVIEDYLFKRFKTLELREEVRGRYDQVRSQLAVLEESIEKAKSLRAKENAAEDPTKSTEKEAEQAAAESKRTEMVREKERYEAQMKALDVEVEGSAPTSEYPEGVQGINQQLEALRELKLMIRDYMKTL